MKWIEIIELRASGSTQKQLETQLQEFLDQVEKKTGNRTVNLYISMIIETDFSIHLTHDSAKVQTGGSPLGARLVSALKAFGLVNHTIWIEKSKFC